MSALADRQDNFRAPSTLTAPSPTRSSTSRSNSPTTTSTTSDAALKEAVRREGAGWAADGLDAFGARAGSAEFLELGALANRNPPELDTHDRYGRRVDLVRFHPVLSRADEGLDRGGPAFLALDRPARGRACRARRALLHADAGRGRPRLPDHHDLRRDALPQAAARPRRAMAAEDPRARLRSAQRPRRAEAGPDDRHGDDREAGRLGRARQHDARHSGRRRGAGAGLRARRPQVLRLGADVRRLPGARAGAGRPLLLSRAALAAGRDQEPAADHPPQAQDGQRLQRLERDGAARRARLDGRAGGPRRARRSSRWSR